jgi:hypothetical protein
MTSGDKIRFFFEENAFDDSGMYEPRRSRVLFSGASLYIEDF